MIEPFAEARRAARRAQRGGHDGVLEAARGGFEDGDLQIFLRAEMRKEAALRKAELACQAADAEPLEACATRLAEREVEDALARLVPFGHALYLRTVVLFVKAPQAGIARMGCYHGASDFSRA